MSTGRERLELQPVQFFQPGQAVDPLAALGRAVEGQFFRHAFEVGDVFEVVLFRRLFQRPDRVGAGERGRLERRQAFFFEFGFRFFPGFGRRRRGLLRVRGRRTRSAPCWRTPGSRRSCPDLTALLGDRFGAEVEVALHLVAGRFQRLGVDFAEDFLFGEVLRADRQADFAVVGVGDDRAAAFVLAFGGFGWSLPLVLSSLLPQAATPRARARREPAGRAPPAAWSCSILTCCLLGVWLSDWITRASASGPCEVSRRCSPASANSSARASRATRIAPASTPFVAVDVFAEDEVAEASRPRPAARSSPWRRSRSWRCGCR